MRQRGQMAVWEWQEEHVRWPLLHYNKRIISNGYGSDLENT